jgi:hypothetical protein
MDVRFSESGEVVEPKGTQTSEQPHTASMQDGIKLSIELRCRLTSTEPNNHNSMTLTRTHASRYWQSRMADNGSVSRANRET